MCWPSSANLIRLTDFTIKFTKNNKMWLIQFMTWAVWKNLHIYSVKKLTMDAEGYDISSLKNKSFFKVSKKSAYTKSNMQKRVQNIYTAVEWQINLCFSKQKQNDFYSKVTKWMCRIITGYCINILQTWCVPQCLTYISLTQSVIYVTSEKNTLYFDNESESFLLLTKGSFKYFI